MPNCSYSPLASEYRVYAIKEVNPGTVVHTGGVVTTLTGTTFSAHSSASFLASQEEVIGNDLTGGRQARDGQLGKKTGTWSRAWDLRPHGTAGSRPDHDAYYVALFGAEPTIVAATSVTYNLDPAIKAFTAFQYHGARGVSPAPIYKYAPGCIVSSATFELGGNVATCSMNGTCFNVVDNVTFSGAGTDEGEGGVTTFPAEPATNTSNGSFLLGFKGAVQLDGADLPTITGMRITVSTGNQWQGQRAFSDYANCPVGDTRNISVEWQFQDTNTSAITNLWSKAKNGTKINGFAEVGTVAGSRVRFIFNGLRMTLPEASPQGLTWVRATTARALGTSSTSGDELSMRFY